MSLGNSSIDSIHQAYRKQRSHLEGQLAAKDAEIAALRAALRKSQRYILQLGIPDKWGRELHTVIDAALEMSGGVK